MVGIASDASALGYAPRIVGYRPLKSATTRFASVRRPTGRAGGPRWSASQATPQHLATPQGSSGIDLSSLPRLGSLPSGGPPAEPVGLDGRHRSDASALGYAPKIWERKSNV